MDQDYTVTNESIASAEPLALPHFQEEVTLLAARPVVPLNKIKNSDSRQPWELGLALVAAILMGALTATLIVYRQQVDTEAIEASPDFDQKGAFATAFAGAEGLATDSKEPQVLSVEKENHTNASVATVAANARPKKHQSPGFARNASKPMRARSVSQGEDFIGDREMDRAERRKLRRYRRESGRARRDRSPEELLRIREIFEGPPRL